MKLLYSFRSAFVQDNLLSYMFPAHNVYGNIIALAEKPENGLLKIRVIEPVQDSLFMTPLSHEKGGVDVLMIEDACKLIISYLVSKFKTFDSVESVKSHFDKFGMKPCYAIKNSDGGYFVTPSKDRFGFIVLRSGDDGVATDWSCFSFSQNGAILVTDQVFNEMKS
jgi:hypothetical protein